LVNSCVVVFPYAIAQVIFGKEKLSGYKLLTTITFLFDMGITLITMTFYQKFSIIFYNSFKKDSEAKDYLFI
jgi:hypothetical protein